MKNKTIYLTIAILLLITGYFAYQKLGKYLPTVDKATLPSSALSDTEIRDIRQNTPIQLIKVYKSQRILELLHQEQVIRKYPMRLGFNPIGHKVQEGDGKTPEGRYAIDWRNPNSAFYKSLHISYPNATDTAKAKLLGVSAGGDIMIHGSATTKQLKQLPQLMEYLPKDDWTWGCIAVRNVDMDEIWKLVDNGTPIEISP